MPPHDSAMLLKIIFLITATLLICLKHSQGLDRSSDSSCIHSLCFNTESQMVEIP